MESTILILLLLSDIVPPHTVDNDSSPIRIGVALSGGAAWGFSHIGVLKVLQREGIPICCISGTSMGSMVGGVYAAGYSAAQIESVAVNAQFSRLFSSAIPFGAQNLPERQQSQRYIIRLAHQNFIPSLPKGLLPLQNIEFLLMQLLSEVEYHTYYNFDSLPISYRAVAVDLYTGKKIILKKGRLEKAIRASIAIPGVFSPELIDSLELVDGGVKQYLPVEPLLELKPDIIIAVVTKKKKVEAGKTLIDIISRTIDLVTFEDLQRQQQMADIVIEPNIDAFSSSDFTKAKELIAAGENAAEASLPEIRRAIAGRKLQGPEREISKRKPPVVNSIRFEGLKVTRKSMLYSMMRTQPGDTLNFSLLIDDLVMLFNTDLFQEVNYRLEPVIKDSVDLIIEIQERGYGYYALGIRYNNIDNLLLGLTMGQSNLWGSGAGVRTVFNLGDPNELRFGFTGTRLFELPFGYRLDGFWGGVTRSYFHHGDWQGDYNIEYNGVLAEMGYSLGHNAFFNIGIKYYNANNKLPPAVLFDTIPFWERVVGPTFNLEFNTLDDLHLPKRGLSYKLSGCYSTEKLKASNQFLKLSFTSDQYIPITARYLIHPGIDLGFSHGDLPWNEYFYTGGANLVGFGAEEFTTRHRAIACLSMDFRLFQLFNQSDYPFYLQFLSNIAYFDRIDKMLVVTDFKEEFHWGVGTGIRTNTPIGPLHLIVGIGDFAKPSKAKINFYLSIGREFRYDK